MNTITFTRMVRRSTQLDVIAYLLIAALLVLSAILGFMVFNSVQPPSGWLFSQESVQLIGLALVGALVFYLLDQHARLRRHIVTTHEKLDAAQTETERAFKSLTSAHHAAEIMSEVASDDALQRALESIRGDLDVDAVAVVSEEVQSAFRGGLVVGSALDSITRSAADTVRTAAPIAAANEADGSYTLAIPLRVMGKLHGVLCLWRAHGRMRAEELEGAALTARVLELGWESRLLFEGVNEQLDGIVTIVSRLIEQRMPGYEAETDLIVALADKVGAVMNMADDDLTAMRVAIRLRDLGVLSDEPSGDLFGARHERRATADHPLNGERLAQLGGFAENVRRAILCHHERYDGSGYPLRLSGAAIPLSARIISACESFVELANAGDSPALSEAQALKSIQQRVGSSFDENIVTALTRVVLTEQSGILAAAGGAA